MQRPVKTDSRPDQMEPYPTAEDLNLSAPSGGHGTGMRFHGSRRGLVVSVKRLRVRGVGLSARARAAVKPIAGELIIERVHDRRLDFQSFAEVVTYDQQQFPSRQAILLDPQIFAADQRGMILYGIEKMEVEGGGMAAYWQTWQIIFGVPGAEPPP